MIHVCQKQGCKYCEVVEPQNPVKGKRRSGQIGQQSMTLKWKTTSLVHVFITVQSLTVSSLGSFFKHDHVH